MNLVTLLMLLLPLSLSNCEQEQQPLSESDLAETSEEPTPTDDLSAGKIGTGEKTAADDEAASLVDSASIKIGNVEANMVPGSLAISTGSLQLLNGNPCEGLGFLECQPDLLKLYLDIAKRMVSGANRRLKGMDTLLKSKTGGGSFEADDPTTKQKETFSYNIVSPTDFQVHTKTSKGPTMFTTVKGNAIEFQTDDTNRLTNSSSESPSRVHTKITYTDDQNFEVDLKLHMTECNDRDVRSPARIRVKVKYSDGIRTGKAQMYNPLWLIDNDDTCDTIVTDATKIFIFTDFVGDDSSTTAALHLLNSSVTDKLDFPDWSFDQIPGNFPQICDGNYCMGEQKEATSYNNNFCVKPQVTTVWGGSCTSSDARISSGVFLDVADWLLPAEMSVLVDEIPTSL